VNERLARRRVYRLIADLAVTAKQVGFTPFLTLEIAAKEHYSGE